MKPLKTKACGACGGSGQLPDDGVGKLLRAERERAGVRVAAMAEALSISETYLYDLERGHRKFTNELLASYQTKLEELVKKVE